VVLAGAGQVREIKVVDYVDPKTRGSGFVPMWPKSDPSDADVVMKFGSLR
jgi:hypothetical protein